MGYHLTTPVCASDRTSKTAYPRSARYEAGLRFFTTSQGRWLSRDPIGELGGFNQYVFIRNNSISQLDAIGLIPCSEANQNVQLYLDQLRRIVEQNLAWGRFGFPDSSTVQEALRVESYVQSVVSIGLGIGQELKTIAPGVLTGPYGQTILTTYGSQPGPTLVAAGNALTVAGMAVGAVQVGQGAYGLATGQGGGGELSSGIGNLGMGGVALGFAGVAVTAPSVIGASALLFIQDGAQHAYLDWKHDSIFEKGRELGNRLFNQVLDQLRKARAERESCCP